MSALRRYRPWFGAFLVGIALAAFSCLLSFCYVQESWFVQTIPLPAIAPLARWSSRLGSLFLYLFGSSCWLWCAALVSLGLGVTWTWRSCYRVAVGFGLCGLGWAIFGAISAYTEHADPWFAGYAWLPAGGALGRSFLRIPMLSVEYPLTYGLAVALLFCGILFLVRLTRIAVFGRFGLWVIWPLLQLCRKSVGLLVGVVVRVCAPLQRWWQTLATAASEEPELDEEFWQHRLVGAQDAGTAMALDEIAQIAADTDESVYALPPSSLFVSRVVGKETGVSVQKEIAARSTVLEEKLNRFGIQGQVVRTERGPIVTLFEYAPAADIKLSRISALADDVSLALGALSLRVIAPIPGKQVVGFEVANEQRQVVFFADIFDSPAYQSFSGAVPAVIGVLSNGSPCIVDLTEQPHMLLAGSTGSGKSVVMHALILGMLGSCTPETLRLIMIDPKRLEFAPYADIPHLLLPIVTEVGKIPQVFTWLVGVMEERYAQLAAAGVRSVQEYRAQKGADSMPTIVVCVDELADIMVTVGAEVEPLLVRLAQMARAAAIHLIVATQRPSVDVITGILKVNFPTRIALKVASKIDSRTILDIAGAEQLLGKGDMLFMQQGGIVVRAHGAFVQSKEVYAVASYLRMQQRPVYETIALEREQGASLGHDALYPEVVAFVKQRKEVSISLVQRQFRIGFNRSARLIDMLEKDGYVAGSGSGKMRRVLPWD